MITAHALHRGHKRLKRLDLALQEGWSVVQTTEGNLTFVKQGLPAIYTSSSASRRLGHRYAGGAEKSLCING
jgi:hypothetical protein